MVKELQDLLNKLVKEHPEVLEKEVQIRTELDYIGTCEFEPAVKAEYQKTDNPEHGETLVIWSNE